jgi:oligopeptide/dipeptide ABC transporter ATP-binding protein
MRQRVLIAMGLACSPALLIADEPTTAIDVTVQVQIMQLLRQLRDEYGMAVLLISHDLGVVASVCDRVAIMYASNIVESAPTRELYARPRHPYTRGLLQSIPAAHQPRERLTVIPGQVPRLTNYPPGCTFAARCPRAIERCSFHAPALEAVGDRHLVACWHMEP